MCIVAPRRHRHPHGHGNVAGAEQVWDYWLVYLTIVVAILVAVTNAIFLTKGMQENEALFMVSVTSPRMAAHGDAHTGDTRGTCTVGHMA